MALESKPVRQEFECEAGFVRRFQPAGTESVMNCDRRAHDCFGEGVEFAFLRPAPRHAKGGALAKRENLRVQRVLRCRP